MKKPSKLAFRKSGSEIKAAIINRLNELQQRLKRRNASLNEFLSDKTLVRSYIVRLAERRRFRSESSLWGKDEIASEQMEEIHKMCERICELEQEVRRLKLVEKHLEESQTFDLSYEELVAYGFDIE